MLIAIINHKHTSNAIKLKVHFEKHSDVICIDSGSELNQEEKKHFKISLGNVYYCGMINAIGEHLKKNITKYKFVYIIASDVEISEHEKLVVKAKKAFDNSAIGVYGPSVNKNGSPHPQMINKNTNRYRKAVFIDGYCFAVRTDLLLNLCPIDTSINFIGWGIDVYLSYLAIKKGLLTVVDDQMVVQHRPSENQEFRSDARNQRNDWFKQLGKKARLYRQITSIELLKNELGASMINHLNWK